MQSPYLVNLIPETGNCFPVSSFASFSSSGGASQNEEVQYVYLGTIKQINGEIWNFQVPCITYYIVASHRLSIFGYIMYFHSTKDKESRIKIFSCIIIMQLKLLVRVLRTIILRNINERIIVQFIITLLLATLVPDISKAHPVVKNACSDVSGRL